MSQPLHFHLQLQIVTLLSQMKQFCHNRHIFVTNVKLCHIRHIFVTIFTFLSKLSHFCHRCNTSVTLLSQPSYFFHNRHTFETRHIFVTTVTLLRHVIFLSQLSHFCHKRHIFVKTVTHFCHKCLILVTFKNEIRFSNRVIMIV